MDPGRGLSDAFEGSMLRAFLIRSRTGTPSCSMMPAKRLSFEVPKASRIEPATSWSFFWSCVE